MTLTIELDAETEARLTAQATQRGVSPEQYAGDLLRIYTPGIPSGDGKLTKQILEDLTRELTRGSEKLPVLSPEANNRESYYEDRW
jgi:hypothetical protein